jgi:acetyltransferase-like isoleucine patch superfamily enzyme
MPLKNIKHGRNFKYVEPVNLYDCEFNDNVFIGPFVEIQKDVYIGSNTRIQSHSFICSAVKIGNNCFIGHGVKFVNDKFSNGKVNFDPPFEETIIGNNVLIGSNSTILPVTIVDDVIIGAGSVVTKDIIEPGIYFGNPAHKKK